jgi:hypothetical protein
MVATIVLFLIELPHASENLDNVTLEEGITNSKAIDCANRGNNEAWNKLLSVLLTKILALLSMPAIESKHYTIVGI